MTSKEKYREICRVERSVPLFSRDWWLDVTCGEGNWDVLLVEMSGKIRAAMPLYIPCKGVITMPPYTQTMGPWFAPCPEEPDFAERRLMCQEFAEALKGYNYFSQHFCYTLTDWLPFYWKGFSQSTRYTYLLKDLHDVKQLWANIGKTKQRYIRQAAGKYRLTVRTGVPTTEFLRLNGLVFERQNLEPYHPKVLGKLIDTAVARGQAGVWGAYDESGRLHAAVFVVFQESSAYYIAGGSEPSFRHTHAMCLLFWEVWNQVADKCDLFDFEGSMIQGVERFFREFGAVQTPYFALCKGRLTLFRRARIKLSRLLEERKGK
ncbi:MAG: GNAT family N-acetyltransferase [Tannerellaceae bacterium]|nr:GNAT family N-acetyltransferase [Tannerellaceae bacterium]